MMSAIKIFITAFVFISGFGAVYLMRRRNDKTLSPAKRKRADYLRKKKRLALRKPYFLGMEKQHFLLMVIISTVLSIINQISGYRKLWLAVLLGYFGFIFLQKFLEQNFKLRASSLPENYVRKDFLIFNLAVVFYTLFGIIALNS